jgi:crotonobetainyl-CoA:carnitine CoA-transferase CaiB-like acyl-CoA transferase
MKSMSDDARGEPANPGAANSAGPAAFDPQGARASGPLVGIKVVDFCGFIAGSYGAMVLGDFGAEVIKVEPLTGDLARAWGPFLAGESRYFQGWNRNKRSLAVNLTTTEGREIVYRLIEKSDVVIENFRPGITEKLQIDYAAARRINPRIIFCSSTAFGSTGPFRARPAYDPVLQAMGGAAQGNVRFSGKVSICSVAVSDYQAAMLAVSGILAALYHREKTGAGQRLETSLLQGILSVQSHQFCQGIEREEEGPIGICPYRLFDTADNPIFVGAATDRFFRRLCEAIEAPELANDPKFISNRERLRNQAELDRRLEPLFRTRPALEWEKLLLEFEVPCGVVGSYHSFFAHPQVEAVGMNPVVEHPTIGPIRLVGVPVSFEKTPGQIQRAAPTLGQHTVEVLREYGYESDAIDRLQNQGIVRQALREFLPPDPEGGHGSPA